MVLLALSIPAAFLSTRRWRRCTPPYLVFVYYALFYVSFHVQTRHRRKIEPYSLVFAAIAVSLPLEEVGRRQDKPSDGEGHDGRGKRRLPRPHKRQA